MFFGSDNAAGVLPEVLAALAKANDGFAPGYGNDDMTKAVEARFDALFGQKVTSFLVPTGTTANALALACCSPPWGMVLSHAEAHIHQDECGAPEFFGNGLKLWPMNGVGAKIEAQTLQSVCKELPQRFPHGTPMKAVSISQTSECGLVYTPREVAAISAVCRAHGLALHMDGARFGNAVAALGASPAEITWQAGVDVLSFGATKGGAMGVEAVIFFNDDKAEEFQWRRKRAGHLFSKHRFLAAQMLAYLDNDLWLKSARHANGMASRLAKGLAGKGIQTGWMVEANSLFAIFPRRKAAELKDKGAVFYEWQPRSLPKGVTVQGDEMLARLITSFATTDAMVDRFISLL